MWKVLVKNCVEELSGKIVWEDEDENQKKDENRKANKKTTFFYACSCIRKFPGPFPDDQDPKQKRRR